MTQKIKFFVGTDANSGCAECQMVFEYSLKKHCSVPYEITWMKVSDDPESFWYGWNTSTWSTPFSGFRYGIAEYCNYEGKAIYCDDDQIWLDDPLKLWEYKLSPKLNEVMTGKRLKNGEIRHCVSLIDCELFRDAGLPHASKMKQNSQFCDIFKSLTFPKTRVIEDRWNCYDGEDMKLEDIGLLHLTNMASNPGIKMAFDRLGPDGKHWYDGPIIPHRRQDVVDLFHQYYNEAIEDGFDLRNYISNKYIPLMKQSQKGYVANNGW